MRDAVIRGGCCSDATLRWGACSAGGCGGRPWGRFSLASLQNESRWFLSEAVFALKLGGELPVAFSAEDVVSDGGWI